ncbi:MAG TPA: branched-chain amino acid ABC transporter permease [Elusimicrobiota bacterium]|nr:branched-chain amino acid ABC transporter permease [Elusimicrobiota bacterium]
MADRRAKWALGLGGLALLIVLPVVIQDTSFAFLVRLAGVAGLYMLLALGLNLVIGFVGLLDLGFMAFYAIGAYTAALLSIRGWPFPLIVLVSVAVSVLIRLAIGFPALRLRGDYLAIVTLGFGEVVRLTLNNWDALTNGPQGLPRVGESIPPLKLLGFAFSSNLHYYYLILACVLIAVWTCLRLNHSRLGRAWIAIREDEVAAELMGVEVTKQKVVAFGLSAVFAAVAGVIFAYWESFVTPESFTFWESVLLVCAVVLGGMGSVPGVLLGSLCIVAVPEILRDALGTTLANARYLIFGLSLALMAIYRPQGLWPSRRRTLELRPGDSEENRDSTLFDVKGSE